MSLSSSVSRFSSHTVYEFIEWPCTTDGRCGNQIYGERVHRIWIPSINEMRPNFLSIFIFVLPIYVHINIIQAVISCDSISRCGSLSIFANKNPKFHYAHASHINEWMNECEPQNRKTQFLWQKNSDGEKLNCRLNCVCCSFVHVLCVLVCEWVLEILSQRRVTVM